MPGAGVASRDANMPAMPRLTLQRKLFLALAAALAALLLVFIALSRWGLQRNLGDYVAEIELSRMDWIATRLEQSYATHRSWRFLADDADAWHRTQMPGDWADGGRRDGPPRGTDAPRGPRPGMDPFRPSGPPPEGRGDGPPRGRGPQIDLLPPRHAPPPPPGALDDPRSRPDSVYARLALLDVDGRRLLAGAPVAADRAARRPLSFEGRTVGYLVVAPLPSVQSDAGRAFIAQQSSFVVATGLVGLLLALLTSAWLARRWLAPIAHLTEAARTVAAGRFDAEVPAQGRDELALLAQTFNDMARRLGSVEASRQRWLSDVAHELRTPVAAMRAEIEALQDGVRPFGAGTADRLHRQVMRLGRLVDDLRLSMDEPDAVPTMQWTDTRPVDLLIESLVLAQPALEAAAVGLDQTGLQLLAGPSGPQVRADPVRLQQVFANLLDNSARYTDAGGRIEVNAELVGDGEARRLVLRFDDTAPGPLPQDLPRLFERLYRGEDSRSRALGGSGLGLAICRTIAQAHGGSIVAQPSPIGGLRVLLRLPLAQLAAESAG